MHPVEAFNLVVSQIGSEGFWSLWGREGIDVFEVAAEFGEGPEGRGAIELEAVGKIGGLDAVNGFAGGAEPEEIMDGLDEVEEASGVDGNQRAGVRVSENGFFVLGRLGELAFEHVWVDRL